MKPETKRIKKYLPILLIIFCLHLATLCAQQTQKDSIDLYFRQIESLVDDKNNYLTTFLNIGILLDQRERVHGEEKVNVLLKLYTAHAYESRVLANRYNSEALKLSENLNFKKGILQSNYNEAYLKFVEGKFDNSMKLAQQLDSTFSRLDFPEIYADITTLKSDIYTERGEYDLALETGLSLLDYAEETKNEYLFLKANAALSHYYLRNENYSKALSYCLAGLHYIIKLKKTEYIFPKIDEIGTMTSQLNNPQDALEIYTFFTKLEKKIPPAGSYIQSSVYLNMATIYMSIGEFPKSQTYLSDALKLNYHSNYRFRIPRTLSIQAELNLKKGDTLKAILNYEKSIGAAENIDAFDVVKANSQILVGLYEKTNQTVKANEYRDLFKMITDSIFPTEKLQKIIILEAKRNIKEISEKKQYLELENSVQESKMNTIKLILFLVFIMGLLAGYSYFKVQKKNKLLYQRTKELVQTQVEMTQKLNQLKESKVKRKKNSEKEEPTHTQQIDTEVKDIILTRLEKLENKHFYLDANCSLHKVAEELKTNPKYLSQVINQEKKANFNNYINELRISYLLPKLLQEPEFRNNKLSYIAISIGYNNLNTFNDAFKKRLGILPSFFISELNNDT